MADDNPTGLDIDDLRDAIRKEYEVVAAEPNRGYHFHTGRLHAENMGYDKSWLDAIPAESIASFAGTGNPFSMGFLHPGENVVDVGSGAGIDSLIAARMVGAEGHVIGVDLTPAMLEKARRCAHGAGISNVEFKQGFGEELPVGDALADVVISNGVLNLMPDKAKALSEMARVLRPGGRLQIADILVQREVPRDARERIELWTG